MQTKVVPEHSKIEIEEDEKRQAIVMSSKLAEISSNLHYSFVNSHTMTKDDFLKRLDEIQKQMQEVDVYFEQLKVDAKSLK